MRVTTLLYDKTSAVAGALDSGFLSTAGFDEVIIDNTVATAVATLTYREINDDGTLGFSTVVGGAVGTGRVVFGPSSPGSLGQVFGLGPVPRRLQVVATAGGGGTVRLVIWGVRHERVARG